MGKPMSYMRTNKSRDIAAFIGVTILAIACLVAAAYHIRVLVDLHQRGVRVEAVVVEIKRGARNSGWAVYRYTPDGGRETIARDKFQLYIKRVKRGQSVNVIYDKNDVKRVTADLGMWTWQAPAIFLFGFAFMAILAFLIWRYRST